jgi:hypothetical protein
MQYFPAPNRTLKGELLFYLVTGDFAELRRADSIETHPEESKETPWILPGYFGGVCAVATPRA